MSSSDISIAIVLGTRPELIKLSPVVRECGKREIDYSIIHTGQHYSEDMDDVFLEQLDIPKPDYNLNVGSKSHGHQTGEMIKGIEDILIEEKPSVVLVQGDTNTVLAGSIAADKIDGISLGHVEAGLRSYNRSMPEESNRRVADHLSDILFAPTNEAEANLLSENITPSRVHLVGNTVVEAVQQNLSIARESSTILKDFSIDHDEFALLTAHRAENVDSPSRFKNILEGVGRVANEHDTDFIYPIHPRSQKNIDSFGLEIPDRIKTIPPQDYLDFLSLENSAKVIVTDSGGVQEEACILKTPCVTIRDATERPETIEVGANKLVGSAPRDILHGVNQMLSSTRNWENPFGDGTSAKQILDILTLNIY